jgi:hypothetical protein
MSMHLFATPVECRECGATVTDPTVDRCPDCGALLKERRTPGRLAGVEQRYGQLRFLIGTIRFLGVVVLLVGALVLLFTAGEVTALTLVGLAMGVMVGAVALFAVAAFFTIALDIEENTRAAFRMQQLIHEDRQTRQKQPSASDRPTSEG